MRKFLEKISTVYQFQPRPNRDAENSFRVYQTSLETERLASEQNRQIYCELIDYGRWGNFDRINDVNASNEKKKWWTEVFVKSKATETLAEISVKIFAKFYRGGEIDKKVQFQNAVDFGLFADVELPIEDVLELDVII